MKKRILSLLLALALVLTGVPMAFATESGFADGNVPEISTDGPVQLPSSNIAEEPTVETDAQQPVEAGEPKLVQNGEDRFSTQLAESEPKADEVVTFIVVMQKSPLLVAGFTKDDIATRAPKAVAYEAALRLELNALKANLTQKFRNDAQFELGYTYTIATTGVAVKTEYGNKEALEALPGVDHVYVAPTFSLPEEESTLTSDGELQPMTSNATTMIGADQLNATGFTGKGMKVAILDTGIVVDHPNFGALSEDKLTESSLTKEGVDAIWNTLNAGQMTSLRNRSYYNSKLPFIFNYYTHDFDVSHATAQHDHGTHVAGITAANKIEGSSVIGVAPDAQIIVMQVFSAGGGAGWDTIMAGLEDCVRLDVDACNLSLGAAGGFTTGDMSKTLELFESTDIEVLIAAGNETNAAYQNRTGWNLSRSGNPDDGVVGTPSTLSAALSVASIDNDGAESLYFTVNGRTIGYNDTATTNATKFLSNFKGQSVKFVPIGGYGEASDYENVDVSGKIALVSRGSSSFPDKQAAAQAAGAIGIVVYNNASGMLKMQINDGGDNIPAVFISKADGEYMKAQFAEGVKTLTCCNGDLVQVKRDRTLSDFSSWGVTPDLKLKPEIAGVGGNIYSTRDPSIAGSNYGLMSGTSMATPQITGAMAVLMQYLRQNYPQYQEAELRQVAANLLMSTADPILDSNGLEVSPRGQGAGLANLVKATSSLAYLSNAQAYENRAKAELGDDDAKNGVYTFPFTINNMSGEKDLTYTFNASILTETVVTYTNGTFIGHAPYALGASLTVAGATESNIMKYDFNDDGEITTADARVLLLHVTDDAPIAEDNVHYAYLDVNGDGTVNKDDVDVITAYCAELEVSTDLTENAVISGTEALESVTVPAGESVTLTATITLTAEDKAYLDASFENGMYVEGFLYVKSATDDTTDLEMPFLGFYGDWSQAPAFDSADEDEASLYPLSIFTNNAAIGTNPYIRTGASGDEYNAFSYANPLAEIDVGLLRNLKKINFQVKDKVTNEVYFDLTGEYMAKSYYNSGYGQIIPLYVLAEEGEVWNGLDKNDNKLPDGTTVTYTASAWLDDGDDVMDDSFSFDVTLDDKAPVVENEATLQQDLKIENGKVLLPLKLNDNQHIAALIFVNNDGIIMGKYEVKNEPGKTFTQDYDITGFGPDFTIVVADYACNETEIDVSLDLGAMADQKPAMQKLSSDRLYGCETFDRAAVEGGWFSANKADMSDYRNETFDSSNRYYSAEYVNGYLVAQRATDGAVVLVTPYNTYWGSQTLVTQSGKVGDSGFKVLYDMALDYSDKGKSDSDTVSNHLYAVGWNYEGDRDGDGKDDGSNALFQISFYSNGSISLEKIADITGSDGEILTLGCTTEGQLYGISTAGKLYSLERDGVCTYIGTTDFVNYANYSGCNVIQSMGYDHNTDTMYWYAHSQTAAGNTYINVCMTYKVDLATGKCTEVGTYGPGGQTSLFVPTDKTSDLFTIGVDPQERFQLSPYQLTMTQGQRKRFEVEWNPWNAKASELTWASADETIATVTQQGFVTAVGEGETEITATGKVWDPWHWDEETSSTVPQWVNYTATATVRVVGSAEAIYTYIVADYKNAANGFTWVTFSDKTPTQLTQIAKQKLTVVGIDGEESTTDAMWQGAAYYNGYVYAVVKEARAMDDSTFGVGTSLYRFMVNKGETPDKTTFGDIEFIGFTAGVELGNMGFDYNTGRMYAVDLTNRGLAIVDLDTGAIDLLGTYSGEIGGPAITPAMTVTAEGYIIVSDMSGNLYMVNADTLSTTKLGSLGQDTWYYASMMYDYNTGNIYWNPCMNAGSSPLCLVRIDPQEWDPDKLEATIVKIGNVSTKSGVESTAMFTIPENEPETKHIPVEGIEITNGDSVTGLVGGTLQLDTVTTPVRPTVRTRTWTSSNPDVVTVDRFGVATFHGVGTATVTVSITNKNPEVEGGPFTDSIDVTVYASAGTFLSFLNDDQNGGSGYYDFWLQVPDNNLRTCPVTTSAIGTYSLRTGAYYDGCVYAYNSKGDFYRFDASDVSSYTNLGSVNLDVETDQVTGMAMDYTTGTMYGLTLSGKLVTINLDNGAVTEIAATSEKVTALAIDKRGVLYAAGSTAIGVEAKLYTVDPKTAACTFVMDIPGAQVGTGSTYYGSMSYNAQMTYDFGTDRLYLHATYHTKQLAMCSGMYMFMLGEGTTELVNLGKISVQTAPGRTTKQGDAYLGLLCSIPTAEQTPVGKVNGILLNKTVGRLALGESFQLTGKVRPSNAANQAITWSSSDENVAKVDANGLVTSVAAGNVVITATSVETGVTATCTLTVVDMTGKPVSTAYTVSAKHDALYSFNPELPDSTATEVATFSGGTNITGLAYDYEGGLYYVVNEGGLPYIYYYDLTSKQTTLKGQVYTFTDANDLAYDPVNKVLYVVAGFYLFQFNPSRMDPTQLNYWTAYRDMSGMTNIPSPRTVACKDGNVYVLARGYGNTELIRADVDLTTFTKLAEVDLMVENRLNEMDYDPTTGLFYVTDSAHRLYSFDETGAITLIDTVGGGLDLNGLTIAPAGK